VFTWDGVGAADAFWSTKQNWAGNTAPTGAGHDLIFSGSSRLANTNDTLTSVNSITFDGTAGAFILSGASVLTLTGNITNSSTSLQTISMALGLNATVTVTSTGTTPGNTAIGGQVSGTGGITKTGTNSLILTGANIYSGTTTITTGTLLANNTSGSATGTGAVSVTGTLGGTGTIAPTGSNGITVNSGGTIAPGDGTTPATLTFNFTSTTGMLTMSSGSGFQFHLGSAGMGDMLAIVGAQAGDVAFNNNVINFMGTGVLGSYKIFDTDSNNANTWTGLTVNGSGQITSGLTASNLANGYSAVFYMGGSTYGGTTGDIYVQVIPEPKAALLGCIGVLLLFRRRRD
jgi:autotransporter-associated beta strand protein